MKGIFIPEITAEMFRSGSLESIEELMAEGEIYDIDYDPTSSATLQWIQCSEQIPSDRGDYLTTSIFEEVNCDYWDGWNFDRKEMVLAWMPLPEPYKAHVKEISKKQAEPSGGLESSPK